MSLSFVNPLTPRIDVQALRQMSDVMDAADKPHWAAAMREAVRELSRYERIEAASLRLLTEMDQRLTSDKIMPIAQAQVDLADSLAAPF
jgi:hypothetical protein